jgi:hypothetical protein
LNLIDNYEHLNPKSEWGRAEEAREERIRTCKGARLRVAEIPSPPGRSPQVAGEAVAAGRPAQPPIARVGSVSVPRCFGTIQRLCRWEEATSIRNGGSVDTSIGLAAWA